MNLEPKKLITYTYYEIGNCNMCQAPSIQFKVLGKRLNKSQGFKPHLLSGITTTVMKCNNCGLIFSNPQPVPDSIADHYNVDPKKYWREEYFKIDENYFKGEIEWFKRLKPFQKNLKSLDIGAGLGKQMIALQNVGFDSYGIEPSPSFYKMATEKMGIDKGKLEMKSIEEASFEDEFFDFISFGAVFEHVYNPNEALVKALKWLKPGGFIHIEVPNSNWLSAKIINLGYKLRRLDYVTNLSPMHSPFHLHEFTVDSFKLNGIHNNYKIEDFGYYVCPTNLPKVFDPILRPIMRKTDTGMQLCVWLKKAE
ncbi:class I SAM-dependent methyltransferase [Marivirga sp. S37H4]|uniref:Class I SAM-dependent methyltransferase n=1 Tax=Marivirga aurantiaca TaxID=2802615 RepID=A0A934X127_9BACT|nr:class I SAM-dependent methyltransferase [Marivirga aurantiaca]MBK6267008.1 class I SAM-dependent methyltransferase [Marivirga aurantiaca]